MKPVYKYSSFALMAILTILMLALNSYAAGEATGITQKDTIYFIMTDRFYDGDNSNNKDVNKNDLKAYHGGDFKGITDKLDYIKKLGFTAIWISPVVKNEPYGYHGYWAFDFYKTEEHFGSMEELKELVNQAHKKDIKVIFDIVVNHTGYRHPWVSDPDHASWFHERGNIANYNDQKEVEEGKLSGLPDLNQDNPEVKKYLIDMAKWWIKQTGIDGYRLDTVKHVSKEFWSDFVKEIKKEYPRFYFIGEVFDGKPDYIADYQKTGIDGITDFPMYYAINDVFGGFQPATKLADAIKKAEVYQNPLLMGTFIDNHDVPRFVNQLTTFKEERLKQALAFTMTYTGIPIMYYGTEIGLEGGSDPDNRRDMDWSNQPKQSPMTDYVKKLTDIRKTNPALTQGNIKVLKAGADFLSYSRNYENNSIISVFNVSSKDKTFKLNIPEEYKKNASSLKELVTNKKFKINNGEVVLNMSPRQVYIFTVEASKVNLSYLILIIIASFLIVVAILIIGLKQRNLKRKPV